MRNEIFFIREKARKWKQNVVLVRFIHVWDERVKERLDMHKQTSGKSVASKVLYHRKGDILVIITQDKPLSAENSWIVQWLMKEEGRVKGY